MNCQPSLLLLTMLTISPFTIADSYSNGQAPSLDFLEFLGEWQDSEGKWIDPTDFEDTDFIKLLDITDAETGPSSTEPPGANSQHDGDDDD